MKESGKREPRTISNTAADDNTKEYECCNNCWLVDGGGNGNERASVM